MMSFAYSSKWFLSVVVSFAGLLALAQSGSAEEVRVTVAVVLATDQNKKVDPDLKRIAQEIQKIEPALTGFRLGQITRKSVQVGEKAAFGLVDQEVATVLVVHGANEKNKVGLTVKPPHMGEVTYTTCCDKFFPIVTRYQTNNKEWLILAIRVQPCKGK
jgi:hypothetical protein